MDSRTFKASRSRRVKDIEFRINVLSIPKTGLCQRGVLARGSKCSAGLAFQALRLFEVFCLLRRNSASLLKNRAGNTRCGSAIAKLRRKPVPEVENPAGTKEGGKEAEQSQ
jgi:hypothetical protein